MKADTLAKRGILSGFTSRSWIDRAAVFVVAILSWHTLSATIVDPFWISSPTLVAERLWSITLNGDLLWHANATVWQAALGLVLGLFVGFAIGLFLVRYPRLAAALHPYTMGSTACRASPWRRCSSCGSASAFSPR